MPIDTFSNDSIDQFALLTKTLSSAYQQHTFSLNATLTFNNFNVNEFFHSDKEQILIN